MESLFPAQGKIAHSSQGQLMSPRGPERGSAAVFPRPRRAQQLHFRVSLPGRGARAAVSRRTRWRSRGVIP